MSWARVDDGLWEHPKFEALRLAGEHRAIALWLLATSYCGQKLNPRLTIHEAMMLLCCPEADAKHACDVLRSTGLLDPISASEQNPSSVIHDWEHYRSKDEAKVRAGRQGGKKSGESRRVQTKQAPSTDEAPPQADLKQTRTPDSDSDSDTDTDTDSKKEVGLEKTGTTALTVHDPHLESVKLVAEHYLRLYPKRYRQAADPATRKKIRARLKDGYTAEQLIAAINGNAASAFHVEGGHTSLELIVRDVKHVDQFLEARPSNGRQPHVTGKAANLRAVIRAADPNMFATEPRSDDGNK